MAILTLTIPDEVQSKYAGYSKNPLAAMAKQLVKFQDHNPDDRVLIFDTEGRSEVEKIFGKPIERIAEFVDFVKSLASLKIGGTEVALTPSQKKRIEGMAKFWAKEPAELAKTLIQQAIAARLGM